tara:strand:- start:561 stop:1271 length:711 start_codon:yes stop_codon:yes gene_type:complete
MLNTFTQNGFLCFQNCGFVQIPIKKSLILKKICSTTHENVQHLYIHIIPETFALENITRSYRLTADIGPFPIVRACLILRKDSSFCIFAGNIPAESTISKLSDIGNVPRPKAISSSFSKPHQNAYLKDLHLFLAITKQDFASNTYISSRDDIGLALITAYIAYHEPSKVESWKSSVRSYVQRSYKGVSLLIDRTRLQCITSKLIRWTSECVYTAISLQHTATSTAVVQSIARSMYI